MQELSTMYPEDKIQCYHLLYSQLKSLIENEPYVIPNLANTSALLNGALKDINWVGFYLINNIFCPMQSDYVNKNELLLGPFQGKTACIHIAIGKGVCGTAVLKNETQLVRDVHEFPGHIACDSASRSEIVIPIHSQGQIVGVLDIDSPIVNRFDVIDKKGLEELVLLLENGCDWNSYLPVSNK